MSKKNKRVTQHNERCKGCQLCMTLCPTQAISVSNEVNRKGYNVMEIDLEKCTTCGSCYTVCPDYVFEILEVA